MTHEVKYSSSKKCDGCGEIKEKCDLTLYVHKVTKEAEQACLDKLIEIVKNK